jgi:hypothetical protein
MMSQIVGRFSPSFLPKGMDFFMESGAKVGQNHFGIVLGCYLSRNNGKIGVLTPSIEGGSPRMMEKKHEKKAYWETLIFVAQLFLKRAQRALWGYYVKNKLEFEGKE